MSERNGIDSYRGFLPLGASATVTSWPAARRSCVWVAAMRSACSRVSANPTHRPHDRRPGVRHGPGVYPTPSMAATTPEATCGGAARSH